MYNYLEKISIFNRFLFSKSFLYSLWFPIKNTMVMVKNYEEFFDKQSEANVLKSDLWPSY